MKKQGNICQCLSVDETVIAKHSNVQKLLKKCVCSLLAYSNKQLSSLDSPLLEVSDTHSLRIV